MSLHSGSPGHAYLVGPDETAAEWEQFLAGSFWRFSRFRELAGVLLQLRTDCDVDLVLLAPGCDVKAFVELCRHIKLDRRSAFVSVVFLLPPVFLVPGSHGHSRAAVFEAGADDCIQLPAPDREIHVRLSNAVQSKRATDSLEDATHVITSLANAIEGRDKYTRGHVERVSDYSMELGRRLGVTSTELQALRIAGIVHDIGKVIVPDAILNKPGRLTDEEMEIVKLHSVAGSDILEPLRTLQNVRPLIRWHHERPNGTGYPDGLKDDELPLLPRILGVADFFDAISTARPYRPAFAPEECREMLSKAASKGDLDSTVVTALIEMLGGPSSFWRRHLTRQKAAAT